jgi:hypothetical protein
MHREMVDQTSTFIRKNGRNLRKRNKTMLNSPTEDFSQTTLAAVAGILAKLQYLAGLRQSNGEYFHWGMARRHGEATTNLTIAQAHTDLFLVILRTPLNALWEEAQNTAQDQSTELREFVDGLLEKRDLLIPSHLQGGAERHFNSVLLGLCCLAGAKAPKADPGA